MRGDTTPEQATQAIARELFANHPERSNTMVFETLTKTNKEAFRRDAEAWLKDRSELDGDVYELADWDDLFNTFSNW